MSLLPLLFSPPTHLPPPQKKHKREKWLWLEIALSLTLSLHAIFLLLLHFQRHRKDVGNFDKQFTSERTDLTPTDKLFMMNLDQNEFAGFSFLNPEYVQHV